MNAMNKIILMVLTAGLFLSCQKSVMTPELKVTAEVEKTTVLSEDGENELEAYKVTFKFEGDPDNVVFYSGEPGSDYNNRNKYTRIVTPHLSFTSSYSSGSLPNTLRVLVSNDFKPEYEYMSGSPTTVIYTRWAAEEATWTDITDRFIIPGNRLLSEAQESGEAIISEFHGDVPLFVAFQFKGDATDGENAPGLWAFSKFNIRNEYEDGTSSPFVTNGISTDWKSVDLADPVQCSRSAGNASMSASTGSDFNTMLISPPYYPSHITPDKGLVIKSTEDALYEYAYTYIAPQEESLSAVFVVTNSLYGESKQIVKEIKIDFK